MFPPVFTTLNQPELQAFVGTDPVRMYDFGTAPQSVERPYITFTAVSNAPHEQISGAPCSDADTVQIDMYADSREQVRAMARVVRQILDNAGWSNRLNLQMYEPDTGLFRISMDCDFITDNF